MRWVMIALLLVVPTVTAASVNVGLPANVPALFTPQIVCSIVLSTGAKEPCDVDGVVASVTHARIVIEGAATAEFYVDWDLGGGMVSQRGDGTCAAPQCAIALARPFSGFANLYFKATGAPGAVATIELAREKV